MKKYSYIWSLGLENAMEYRVDFILSLISTVFPIIIQIFLWNAIYSEPGSINNGYSYQQIIVYTLMAGITSKLVMTGFEYEINSDIKDGGLNKYIVKPVNYYLYRMASFLGSKIPAAGILLVIMTLLLTGASGYLRITIEPARVLFYVITLALALLLNYTIFFSVAMLAFWITEVSKLFGTISIVLVVISGGVFPLDIFGGIIKKINYCLPFRYTTQFPVDILSGKLSWNGIYKEFICQLGWIAVFLGIGCLLWKKGMKRYVSAGG